MRYKNEDEIKKALGIDSWRNLSKDKMTRFAAMMPDMGTEVTLKIIEQFPSFKDFANEIVDAIKQAHGSTLSSNSESQEHFYQILHNVTEVLRGELDKGDLTQEERKDITDKLLELAKLASYKDSENKQFLAHALKSVRFVAGAAIVAGVVFVGGKVIAGSDEGRGESCEA